MAFVKWDAKWKHTNISNIRCDLFIFHAVYASIAYGSSAERSVWRKCDSIHKINMSNRSAKLCMFLYTTFVLLLLSFVIIIFHSVRICIFNVFFIFYSGIIDVPFVLLGSWEMIYRFVVGSRNCSVWGREREYVGFFVCLAFNQWTASCWKKSTKNNNNNNEETVKPNEEKKKRRSHIMKII